MIIIINNIIINIDPSTKRVKVRLTFNESSSANKAFNAMNDRFFAGNRIKASLV